MKKLIELDAAIESMAELQGRAASKGELTGISKAWKRIKALPTVDAVPCDVCRYSPPSSMDGKPCTVCPAVGKDGDHHD